MFKSMTGFGRGEYTDTDHRFIVEIRAVNHRFNDIVIKMPKNLAALEDRIRKSISGTLARGRIDVLVLVDDYQERKRVVRVDKNLAHAYFEAIKEISDTCGLDARSINPFDLAKMSDVLKIEETAEDLESLWPKISGAIEKALINLMEMRVAEGDNIYRDLIGRIEKIRSLGNAIAERAPIIVAEYRERLRERCREIMQEVNVDPDETRLLQEVAILADRINITEELVRLDSHLDQFTKTMKEGSAIGRKLDFILQELNREANTIGSKANDKQSGILMVELKSEIEKVREQIQNVE